MQDPIGIPELIEGPRPRPIPSPPEEPPVHPVQRLRWHRDLCHNAIFSHAKRPAEHYPQPGDEWPQGWEPGFFEFRTVKPVRAVDVLDPGPNAPVCRMHYAKRHRRPDGFFQALSCSQPGESMGSDRLSRQTSVGHRYMQREADPNERVETGFGAYVGAYHAPYWTELLFHSHHLICGQAGE